MLFYSGKQASEPLISPSTAAIRRPAGRFTPAIGRFTRQEWRLTDGVNFYMAKGANFAYEEKQINKQII